MELAVTRWLLVPGAVLALACASVQVTSETTPGADFSHYRTYAQQPPPPAAMDPAVRADIAAEIDAVLAARGFAVAPLESADLVVVFRGGGQDRSRLTDIGFPGSAQYVVDDYVEGTLVIDVFARGGSRLWHGVGSVDVTDADALRAEAARAVQEVLAGFPPPPPGSGGGR